MTQLHRTITDIVASYDLDLPADEIEISELDGGASNQNFLVRHNGTRHVFRYAAPAKLSGRFALDRWAGLAAHQHAARSGVAPEVLGATLPSGHTLVSFIDGETLAPETVITGTNLRDSTLALREVHLSETWGCRAFNGLVEIERFMAIANDEALTLPDDIEELVALARQVEAVYRDAQVPEVLCHNDVQIANLIRDGNGKLWVIDWEYGGIGNPYFDLAMLVNNASLNREHTSEVLTAYFGVDRHADYARIQLSRFQSAMREALWSVVAEPVLDTGWDYQGWAQQFFDSARSMKQIIEKEELLKASGPHPDDTQHFERLKSNG